jgi:hypothetical protein
VTAVHPQVLLQGQTSSYDPLLQHHADDDQQQQQQCQQVRPNWV